MALKTILFDLDGTLTDPKEGITRSIQFALTRLGREVPETESLIWCIGPPLRQCFAQLLETTEAQLLGEALTHYRSRFSEIGLFENTVYPDIPEALRRIRDHGYRLFLATSKPHVFATRILDHFGLRPYFAAVYGSELDGTNADKGELIAHLLAAEGLRAEETLMVGDRIYDIRGARQNGLRVAIVAYGHGTPAEWAEAEPDLIFYSPGELADYLVLTA